MNKADLIEQVANELNYPNHDSVLAIDKAEKIIKFITEQVKADCKVAVVDTCKNRPDPIPAWAVNPVLKAIDEAGND